MFELRFGRRKTFGLTNFYTPQTTPRLERDGVIPQLQMFSRILPQPIDMASHYHLGQIMVSVPIGKVTSKIDDKQSLLCRYFPSTSLHRFKKPPKQKSPKLNLCPIFPLRSSRCRHSSTGKLSAAFPPIICSGSLFSSPANQSAPSMFDRLLDGLLHSSVFLSSALNAFHELQV